MKRIVFSLAAAFLVSAAPAALAQQDPAELLLRVTRLETQLRQMSGQIEALQFQNRKLEEELTRFRKDVDIRFEDLGKPAARSGGAAPPRAGAPTPVSPPPAVGGRRSDAFDPDTHPESPGVPRQLGSTPASPPLDLSQPRAGGSPPPIGVSPPSQARADFDVAMGMIQRGEYPAAEMAFRQFLQSHPRSALAPDATYWLGESYSQRNLHRDAAEQYLKVTTNWPQSARAADSMLKLGVSLAALGARDQACSTYREVDRKYPNASPGVKRGVEREFKRARCAA